MNFKMIATAAALVAAGTANAAIDSFNGGSVQGNGSLVLVLLDDTGANQRSLTVDLGYNWSDFNTFAAGNNVAGTSISWDLANNTITKNGALVSGASTNAWSAQLADFLSKSEAAETKWAVISGSQKGNAPGTTGGYLTTGTPDASQLTQQNSTATGKFNAITSPLIDQVIGSGVSGTLASATNGAYSAGSQDTGFVGTAFGGTQIFGWQNAIKWDAWSLLGGTTNFYRANATGTEVALGDTTGLGTLSFNGTVVTYSVPPAVPEPESFVLAFAGLAALAVARRRAAK